MKKITGRVILHSRLDSIDWDFSSDKCASSLTKLHWHPCRFVAQIPAALIGLLSVKGDLIVDPFCGSGTTLVEAQRLGRRAIGIDINPISTMISKAKVLPYSSEEIKKGVEEFSNEFMSSISKRMPSSILSEIPESVQADKWYSPSTQKKLALIWSCLKNSSSEFNDIFYTSFSSILLNACNETRHWGYVCDNTKPKNIRDTDPIGLFINALNKSVSAYEQRDRFIAEGVDFPLPESQVVNENSTTWMQGEPENTVDLIVTSPPYFGVCDYVKAQRLSMEWFGYSIQNFRRQETGARSKRQRQRASEEYLKEIDALITQAQRVLKPKGHMVFVIGESESRTKVVDDVKEFIFSHGFEDVLDKTRKVSLNRRLTPSIKEESIIIGKKL